MLDSLEYASRKRRPIGRRMARCRDGIGLTGVTYETTPGGRPGWQMVFLRAGHDVFVTDAVERARSGRARFPQILAGKPVFRSMGAGWGIFRIGEASGWSPDPALRRAVPETLFPVTAWN